ncbi:rho GTPase-activating protein 20-like isoform X2 [Anthonomus grandis grandis]|uniref:rho GTPase-activating protein 20-like isoform X2 n=1 Tax=Anthonomus grandis grandis TaxID=2921223 RepID=UPI0021655231|nr:rho GTPase-activating protein 20-like isoform X2 [Anthonomus grandis grandis]
MILENMCKTHIHERLCFKPSQAERLAEYSRFLGGSQPNLDGRQKDLDRIQDLFPQDYLGLHMAEPCMTTHHTLKTKSFRKKSLGDLTAPQPRYDHGRSLPCKRIFLMEAPCEMRPAQLAVNSKSRHLFLFSDLLLIAKKVRTTGVPQFKLKESVRVSELWMEDYRESETGFYLGWPSPARTFLVTFFTQAAKESWWRELSQVLATQLSLEHQKTNIKVVYRDPLSSTEWSKTFCVRPDTTCTDIKRWAIEDTRTCETSYTLYTRDRDNAPCPLIGCERPHSIQFARMRQSTSAEEGFDLNHCNRSTIPCDVVFELRPVINVTKPSPRKRDPLKQLFRKSSAGRIFGVQLSKLCPNNCLPPVILTCLQVLFQKGPHTQGIFRRCAAARALRELKEKVDSQGATICEEILNTPALLLGALLKDFLRSLPEPLLAGNVQEWLNAATSGRLDLLRRLLSNLPRENHMLLRYVICVLYNIAKKSRNNLMSPLNLGVCVGPSMLWESSQSAPLRTLPTLIETLINNCQALFGSQVVSLLGEVANDSGAEESDSLHSLGLSLDSSVELSKDQKSLSRDSGLTLSEDDRDSPGLNYYTGNFYRSDWARQPARPRIMDNIGSSAEEDDAYYRASNENLCSPPPRHFRPSEERPPVPPKRLPPQRVHMPPNYRSPPPPHPYQQLLSYTDAESYV